MWARSLYDVIQIEVSEQGIGTPVEERERIFEAFQQVDHPFRCQGAGLGMIICKGIVEAHGGRAWDNIRVYMAYSRIGFRPKSSVAVSA